MGAVVQAGSIQQVTLAGAVMPGLVPRQLPPAVGNFVGRVEQLAVLDTLLSATRGEGGVTGAVVISAVDGLPGVGKTALAVFWAHKVQDRFPDGTLHVNLRGYGPGEPASPGEILDGFLRALGVLPERIPIGVEARVGMYRSLLAGRRMLIVLDNANSAEQVRPLLPGTRGCLVLVTSRDSLTGLVVGAGAIRVTLSPLMLPEAVELVEGAIGHRRADVEWEAVRELSRLCGQLPLALRIAGCRIAARPHLRVAGVVAEMVDGRGRLDMLSTSADEATSVRAVFGWSYLKLTAEQASLFRRLGLNPGPEVSVCAAAAVAGLTMAQARRLLDDLAEVHLVELATQDRYRLHDLLRAYAVDRADHDDSPQAREEAFDALLGWYAYTAASADRFLYPPYVRGYRDLDKPPGALPVMKSRADAQTWFANERKNLVAAIRYAAHTGLDNWVVQLVHTLGNFLYHCAYWDDLFDMCALGIAAARRSADQVSEVWFVNRVGWARLQVSGWDDAVEDLHRCLALAHDLDVPFLEAYARNDLGMGCLQRNRYADALTYLWPALPLSQGTDSGRQEAFVRINISSALAGLGQYHLALTYAEQSLALRTQAKDYEGKVYTLYRLAQIWQKLGDHDKAIAFCEEALGIRGEYVYLPDVAAALDTLGTSLQHAGDIKRAEVCWLKALDIYDKFADRRAPNLRIRLQAVHPFKT